ncbi:MAG: HypC/HybG/HupF family hydrogenase formation chaperone [Thermoplasmata archaeon]
MCLAVPGKILEINEDDALVDFGGVTRKANISLVDVSLGDHIIVHAGYAIQKLSPEEAKKTLDIWDEILEAQS